MFKQFLTLAIFLLVCEARPTKIQAAMNYMVNYGYLPETMRNVTDYTKYSKQIKNGLQEVQMYFNLEPTGTLDSATLNLMNTPRCGVPDKFQLRPRRYVHHGNKWSQNVITYRIDNYPKLIQKSEIDSTIRRAFSMWLNYIPLAVLKTDKLDADLVINFEPLDGENKTLALADFPTKGKIYFDNAEAWTIDVDYGVSLIPVAVHEIGHALGLLHTPDRKSVMYPHYREYNAAFGLIEDDIRGIEALYGTVNKK